MARGFKKRVVSVGRQNFQGRTKTLWMEVQLLPTGSWWDQREDLAASKHTEASSAEGLSRAPSPLTLLNRPSAVPETWMMFLTFSRCVLTHDRLPLPRPPEHSWMLAFLDAYCARGEWKSNCPGLFFQVSWPTTSASFWELTPEH